MRQLILTAAFGYRARLLRPLLESAREHAPDASIVILVRASQAAEYAAFLREYPQARHHPVASKRARPQALWNRIVLASGLAAFAASRPRAEAGRMARLVVRSALPPKLSRYFIFERILARSDADQVLLCDSRDVFFQASPFPADPAALLSGVEPTSFGRCPINTAWLAEIYPEIVPALTGKPVVCSGATVGPADAVRAYLRTMCDEIWDRLPRLLASTHDQIVHNRLIYEKRVSVRSTTNADGLIATLHHEQADNILVRSDHVELFGHRPAIMHQWDRHPALMEYVERRYAPSRAPVVPA